MTFVLEGSEFDLLIDYSNAGSISNGLGDNRTVYAEGIFQYKMERTLLRQRPSRPLAHQNTKKKSEHLQRLIEIESVAGFVGIGGS